MGTTPHVDLAVAIKHVIDRVTELAGGERQREER